MTRPLAVFLAILGVCCVYVEAFAPATSRDFARRTESSTELGFGLPSFGSNDDDDKGDEDKDPNIEKKSIGLQGLVQLITAGAGSPFLGEFQVRRIKANQQR